MSMLFSDYIEDGFLDMKKHIFQTSQVTIDNLQTKNIKDKQKKKVDGYLRCSILRRCIFTISLLQVRS